MNITQSRLKQSAPPPPATVSRIISLYVNGFRSMTLGRTLWKVILLKLLIMFGVLKLFFFPDFLHTNFTTDAQRAEYVLEQLTRPAQGR